MNKLQLEPNEVIPTVNQVESRVFPPDNPGNPKGANTWNWSYPPIETITKDQGRTMIACRLKNDEVGNHFHPRVPNKDPERFLLIMGSVIFYFRDLFGGHRKIGIEANLTGPVEVLIPPYILHWVKVTSPTTWFLEQQGSVFDPNLNRSAEEFYDLAESLALIGRKT